MSSASASFDAIDDRGALGRARRQRDDPLEVAEAEQVAQVRRQRAGRQPDRARDLALAAPAQRDRLEDAGGLLHLGQLLAQQELGLAREVAVDREELAHEVLHHRPMAIEPLQVRRDPAADEVRARVLLARPPRVERRGLTEPERLDAQVRGAAAVQG